MSPRASGCGYLIGAALLGGGGVLMSYGLGQGLGMLVFGIIIIAAIRLEPRYGRQKSDPVCSTLAPTGERFVDDETGQLVEVWYDAASGERSYRLHPAEVGIAHDRNPSLRQPWPRRSRLA
jgi:hypothetical protein